MADIYEAELSEKLIVLNRVTKVVKGGRRFSFSALVVVGNKDGKIGYGFGKANDVSEAIRKSVEKAKRNLITVAMNRNKTIPHQIVGKFKSSNVLLMPATPGTGIIAGGPVRTIFELAGYADVLSKSLGSRNSINVVKATFEALEKLESPQDVARRRNKKVKELWS